MYVNGVCRAYGTLLVVLPFGNRNRWLASHCQPLQHVLTQLCGTQHCHTQGTQQLSHVEEPVAASAH